MINGTESQELFRRACAVAAGDPDHVPAVDLTRPGELSPSAAERATWKQAAA